MSKTISADGLYWNVVEAGQGPVVLLVHGTAASVHSWRKVMPLLSDRYHVVALDLPGHGQTRSRGPQDLSLDRMARGVAAVMMTMKLSPQTVAGHSAGAAILVRAVAEKLMQPQTLISFNGAFFPYGGAAASLFSPIAKVLAFNTFLPRLLSSLASRATVERLLRDTGSDSTPEDVDLYFNLLKQPAHVAAALGMMAAWDLNNMEKDLGKVRTTCVFVTGKNDRAVPPHIADKAAAYCPVAKLLHHPLYGHLLHEENPALAAAIIAGKTE